MSAGNRSKMPFRANACAAGARDALSGNVQMARL